MTADGAFSIAAAARVALHFLEVLGDRPSPCKQIGLADLRCRAAWHFAGWLVKLQMAACISNWVKCASLSLSKQSRLSKVLLLFCSMVPLANPFLQLCQWTSFLFSEFTQCTSALHSSNHDWCQRISGAQSWDPAALPPAGELASVRAQRRRTRRSNIVW